MNPGDEFRAMHMVSPAAPADPHVDHNARQARFVNPAPALVERRALVAVLVLLLGASVLAGCGSSESVDACADGIRETVRLANIDQAAERAWLTAIDDDASSERIDELRQRYDDANDEGRRSWRLTSTACDFEGRAGRERPGSEAACSAAVEVWAQGAQGLADAQSEWASAVRGWDESPGDVNAAETHLRDPDASKRLAEAYETRRDAYSSLEFAFGPSSTSSWAYAACGEAGKVEACAQAIELLDKWERAEREAEEAADARVASYTTPEDDTAYVLGRIANDADRLAESAC